MTSAKPRQASARCIRGFTLIEMLIALAILAILAAVAFPSFMDSVRKGRRAEAFAALANLQQAQERWRGNNADFAALADLPGVSANTPNGHYVITSIVSVDPTLPGYTATATAQGNQANDGTCKVLAVKVERGNVSYGSGLAAVVWADPDPGRCWAK